MQRSAPLRPPNAPPISKRAALLPLIVDEKSKAANAKLLKKHKRFANDGILQLSMRRDIPTNYDLEPAFVGPNGPMRATAATLHSAQKKATRDVMTESSGYTKFKEYKLDFSDIERIPGKMNIAELKQWELEEEIAKLEQEEIESNARSISTPSVNSLPGMEQIREDARTYAELLDLYSMHEFTIRKGKTLRNTPEFASFKRQYNSCWGSIESLIETIECFLKMYGIDLAYIDGKKVALLAGYQTESTGAIPVHHPCNKRLMTQRDLVSCIANREDVEPLLGSARQQFVYGTTGHHVAATTIQSAWRMYAQRVAYVHLLLGTRAATIIQRQWAVHRAHLATRRAINSVKETRLIKWKQTMANFTAQWPTIRESKRTIIHIPSLSFPAFHTKHIPFFIQQQLGQLTRLSDLADPNVDIVFVVPFKPEAEILTYYETLLQDAGIKDVSSRLTVLLPEEAHRLPEGMSLTRLVLLSARLMKVLKAIAVGRHAFIIPGVIGQEELTLATLLNIPLLGPFPQIAEVFGSKSGVHRLLESSEVMAPPGATQLRSRAELLRALAKLMVEHRSVLRWVVKIETESNSRGLAYFDSGRIKALREEQNGAKAETRFNVPKSVPLTTSTSADNAGPSPLFTAVLQELEDYGGKRVRLVHPSVYPDWLSYLRMVDRVGACISAVPGKVLSNITANLFIEPTGEVHLESVIEPLQAPAFTVLGSCFPPSTPVPYTTVRDAALNVARAAFRKRVIGFMSVDFVLYLKDGASNVYDPSTESSEHVGAPSDLRLCGIDVDLGLSNNAAAHRMICTVTNSTWNPYTGECVVFPRSQESREGEVKKDIKCSPRALCYVYSGIVYNPYMAEIQHAPFFSLCRSKGLVFDRQRMVGLIFHLIDTLFCGCLGAVAVGTDLPKAVRRIGDYRNMLNFELPKQGEHAADSNFVYFSSVVRQMTRILRSEST